MLGFDPPDSPALPAVVRSFVAARQDLLAVWLDRENIRDPAWSTYTKASNALADEVRARGGRWEVDGIVYRTKDESYAVMIEQAIRK